MKKMACLICLSVLVVFAGVGLAQSGRTTANPGGKANPRQAEPQKTPPTTISPTPDDAKPTVDDGEIIKINTELVSVPVRVMDKNGRFISGLGKEQFKVFENGVEQEVALFSNEHQPFTVALMLDMSYSTTFKVAEIQDAAIAFIGQLRPQDKVMVVSFDEKVHMLCETTDDRQAIYRAIKSTRIATGTSLYEAVDLVMNDRMRHIQGRKAIIMFTDGVDTTSRRSNDLNNLGDAMELDSLIYTIRYDTFADVQRMKNGSGVPISIPIPGSGGNTIPFPGPIPSVGSPGTRGTTAQEYKYAEEYLTKLADRTGGRIYLASTLNNLADSFSKIASELREFYSLGYYPKQDRIPGKNTNIKIRVDQTGVMVRAREGYIVPKKTKINGH